MAFASWSIKQPSLFKGTAFSSIEASVFTFTTHSKYGLSCYNGDQERGTIDISLGEEELHKFVEIEEWASSQVAEEEQFRDYRNRAFHSSIKENLLRAKVNLKTVRVWTHDGSQAEVTDLFAKDIALKVMLEPKRLYFAAQMWGIVWELTDVLIQPKEVVSPFK